LLLLLTTATAATILRPATTGLQFFGDAETKDDNWEKLHPDFGAEAELFEYWVEDGTQSGDEQAPKITAQNDDSILRPQEPSGSWVEFEYWVEDGGGTASAAAQQEFGDEQTPKITAQNDDFPRVYYNDEVEFALTASPAQQSGDEQTPIVQQPGYDSRSRAADDLFGGPNIDPSSNRLGWDAVRNVCFEGYPLNHQLQSFSDCVGHIGRLDAVPLAARLGFLTSAARCQSSAITVELPGLLRWPPECTGACYQAGNSAGDAAPYTGAAHTCRSDAYCLPREAGAACPPFMTPCAPPATDLLAGLDCAAVRAVLAAAFGTT
jgi:hypothetical protein